MREAVGEGKVYFSCANGFQLGNKGMTPQRRRLSWILIGLPVILLVAVLIVVLQAKAFLRSDRFRTFLGNKVSHTVRAQGSFQKLEWSGSSFYTNGFSAIGAPGSSLESIEAEQMRAEVNLEGLWNRKWQVESVEMERLTFVPSNRKQKKLKVKSEDARPIKDRPEKVEPDAVVVTKASPKSESRRAETTQKKPDFLSSLLPNQVDVQRVSVANFSIDGKNLRTPFSLEGTKIEAKPDGKAWMLEAFGGSLIFPQKPKIGLSELGLRYVDKTLFVSRGSFTLEGGGSATVNGQMSEKVQANTDLNITLEKMPVATILPKDWRARLHGQLSSNLHVVGDGQEWTVSGPVTLTEGRLEALPVLDQVALFTRTQRFRQLNLEKVTADVVIKEGLVKVSNMNAESPGLVRMTGDFVIENGQMVGDFMVGVTPASLRYIPGSQTKIFTIEREGYLWTPMTITGPLNHLQENLSDRLAVAAGQEIINTLQNDPSKLKDTLKDAAQSLLDLFGN